jgi:hypothetical protein
MPTRKNLDLSPALWVCLAVYFGASLTHFVHNAEYIASYPNMPGWITRNGVYLAWMAINAVGLVGLALLRSPWRAGGLLILALYGLLGLDGLGHYTLALCSQHTLVMNATIWFEVAAGLLLAAACVSSGCRLRPTLGVR